MNPLTSLPCAWLKNYAVPGALPCQFAATQQLAAVLTRLAKIDDEVQEQLINWGYAICDAAMRLHVVREAAAPAAFPYPRSAIGEMTQNSKTNTAER